MIDSENERKKALEKLEGRDKVGVTGEALSTVAGAAAGTSVAGTVASMAGASTLLGSSTIGSIAGGVFVTTTPVGWVIGCAAAAGALGYGISKLVQSGTQQDEVRKELSNAISQSIDKTAGSSSLHYSDFSKLLQLKLNHGLITREQSQKLHQLVESKSMSLDIAIDRLSKL